MTQKLIQVAAASFLLIGAGAISEPAHAQFGDLKKMAKKKAKKEKRKAEKALEREVDRAVDDALNTSRGAVRSAVVGGATTAAVSSGSASASGATGNPPVQLTRCSGVRPTRVVYGKLGTYTYQEGMSQDSRTGFINRRDVAMTGDCLLPVMQTHEVAYLEFDEAAFKGIGSTSDWDMQCVRSADTSYSVHNTETRTEYPANTNYVKDTYMRLHCGNSEGLQECSTGSNSDLASGHSSDLKARGKKAFSFIAPPSHRSPAAGEGIYCQYYNSGTGTSLFGVEYLRTAK